MRKIDTGIRGYPFRRMTEKLQLLLEGLQLFLKCARRRTIHLVMMVPMVPLKLSVALFRDVMMVFLLSPLEQKSIAASILGSIEPAGNKPSEVYACSSLVVTVCSFFSLGCLK